MNSVIDSGKFEAHSKPSMKKLLPFVVLVAPNWYELGVMLLKEEQEPQLKTIKSEYGNDVRKCCLAMLEYWMDTHPEATWYHLTTALKSPGVDLAAVASEVEKNFTADHIRPTVESSISVDFADFKNVVDAFTTLMRIFTEELSCANFITIRTICLTRASKRLRNEICRTTNIHDLFTLLACNPLYFNWMNVEYLWTMAIAAGSTRLLDILKNYTDVVLSKTLGEVWGFVPSFHKAKVKYYSEVKARFHGMNPDNITVKELKKYEPRFAKKIALHIMRIEKGSLTITWCILAEEAYHGYQLALNIPQESRQDTFLQIGKWVVFHPQSVLQELKKAHAMITTATLLIGYYHGLLMRNINFDLLADKMCSIRLLTTHKSNIISFGNSIHHRNWMLLEQVRHFDVHALIIFCELVQEIWPQIGSQLFTALKHQETAEVNQVANIESVVPKVHVYYEIQSLHILFLYLIDQVSEILLSYKMELFPQCKNLKASDIHSINLFSAHQIDELSGFNTPSILVVLSPLFTWSNHSILRALVSCCGKAIKLLDEFDSKVDPLQPVTSFPISCLYCDMIPSDTSTYTILGIRCKIELHESSLQYLYDVQSLMVEKCGITQHCLQLLAVRSNPTIFYWTIPKHVVYLIDANVPQHNEYLYSQGILEVMVYPDLIFITGDDICLGSLTFLCENQMLSGEIEDVAVTNQIRKLSTETLLKHDWLKNITMDNVEKQKHIESLHIELEVMKVEIKQLHEYINENDASIKIQQLQKQNKELHQLVNKSRQFKHLETVSKVRLEEGEPTVFQEQSDVFTKLEEDIEDLEEQVCKRGMNPEVISELEGSVKLPSYGSASKNLDALIYHNVIIHKELGSGSYGTEYQVSSDGKLMAGKVLHHKLLPTGEKLHKMIEQFKSDCFLAVKMNHPHVIKYFGMCFIASYKFPMLLQEFATENLILFLERTENTLTFAHKLKLSLEMASGLKFLHAQLIVHKNLDASNVLIGEDGHAKISDFITPQLDDIQFSSQNNSVYIAPEVLKSHKYFSCESDIFSLGVLNLHMFTEVTFTAGRLQETVQDVKYKPLKQLICSCINDNVMDRPNASQVCQQIVEIQRSPTAVGYEALTSQNPIDFTEAIISRRYTIRWSQCKPLDLPTWWAYAVTIGEKVYVCGGNSAATQSEDVFVYHILQDTWRTLPQPGVYYAVPVNVGGKLTLIGGRDTAVYKFSAKLLTFDDSTHSWIKQFPDLLTARSRPGVVVCSHYLIVAGGKLKSKGQFSNVIEFLDLEESPLRWKKSVVKLPTYMWDLTVFSSENHFWIVGYGDNRRRNFVHRIVITDIVSSVPSAKKKYDWMVLPETVHWKCAILSNNGSVPVLLAGENKENAPSDAVYYFDFDTFAWMECQIAFLSTPRAFPAVSLIGKNAVITIGGCSDSKLGKSEDYSVTSVEIGILEIQH